MLLEIGFGKTSERQVICREIGVVSLDQVPAREKVRVVINSPYPVLNGMVELEVHTCQVYAIFLAIA